MFQYLRFSVMAGGIAGIGGIVWGVFLILGIGSLAGFAAAIQLDWLNQALSWVNGLGLIPIGLIIYFCAGLLAAILSGARLKSLTLLQSALGGSIAGIVAAIISTLVPGLVCGMFLLVISEHFDDPDPVGTFKAGYIFSASCTLAIAIIAGAIGGILYTALSQQRKQI